MVTNLLVNIAVGILILLILSVIVITIMFGLETTTAEPKQLSIEKENGTLIKQDEDAFSIQLNHALVLKLLISCEGLTYIVVNLKMLQNWVSG